LAKLLSDLLAKLVSDLLANLVSDLLANKGAKVGTTQLPVVEHS